MQIPDSASDLTVKRKESESIINPIYDMQTLTRKQALDAISIIACQLMIGEDDVSGNK